ncbi:SCO2524 family protein [Yinghuangia aomiensis]|uniref:SCO2524 family protein n=1 Tax=Yinghuangia aomiensis TaxID=676205 RepID=A0ABP9H4S9_9ACTN
MLIRPRQQILEIWRGVARLSDPAGQGRQTAEANSITDAEKLLCLMYPAYELDGFRLDTPDETADDVLDALRTLGDRVSIPRHLTEMIADFLEAYTEPDGTPVFSGGNCLVTADPGSRPAPAQLRLDVVNSLSMSLTLTLTSLRFLKAFGREVRRPDLRRRIAAVEEGLGKRLTASMVGLIRSFAVRTLPHTSPEGRALLGMLGNAQAHSRNADTRLANLLRPIRFGLIDLLDGADAPPGLDDDEMLFECGWAWSVRKDAPLLTTAQDIGGQPDGVAEPVPDLYFTVIALDGLMDIFTDRTLMLSLLTAEQQQLAHTLRLQAELTHRYWSVVACFGDGTWPLERLPWQTVDGRASDYFTLLVMSVVAQDLLRRQAGDEDLERTIRTIELLAIRARIPQRGETAVAGRTRSAPAVNLELPGSETLGPPLRWPLSDFPTVLLKRAVQFAGLAHEPESRDRLLRLAEATLAHVWESRRQYGPADGLWHEPSRLPDDAAAPVAPSWTHTERVVESLVAAAGMLRGAPLRSTRVTELARGMILEAEHLLGQELLQVASGPVSSLHTSLQRMQSRLRRAREILGERPGSAYAIVAEVLRELDELTAARQHSTSARA